ncbi:MAG TPA: hypothetical protein VK467_04105 [Gemmatimonadales bacterium]|nr:hypothetical protein [Gemmatimonadales bacterium]
MGITEAQAAVTKNTASATSDTLAYGSSVAVNSLLVAGFRFGSVGITPIVSDNVNGAWVRLATRGTVSDGTIEVWSCLALSAGTPTVSVVVDSAATTMRWSIHAYTADTALAVRQMNMGGSNGTPGTTASGYDITTTAPDALVLAFEESASNGQTYTAEATYTLRAEVPAAPNSRYTMAHKIATTSGAYSGTFTFSGADNWQAILVAFDAQPPTTVLGRRAFPKFLLRGPA